MSLSKLPRFYLRITDESRPVRLESDLHAGDFAQPLTPAELLAAAKQRSRELAAQRAQMAQDRATHMREVNAARAARKGPHKGVTPAAQAVRAIRAARRAAKSG